MKNFNNQSGIYIVLAAGFLLFFLVLCYGVLAFGYLSSNKTKLKNIANLASLAALEELMRDPDRTYKQAADAALARANQILAKNKLIGSKDSSVKMNNLTHCGSGPEGGNGCMELGMWYHEKPKASPFPCGQNDSDYPCFKANPVPVDGLSATANSVRIKLKNKSINPIVLPFAQFVGGADAYLSASAGSTLTQRCIVMAIDASGASFYDSHIPYKPDAGMKVIKNFIDTNGNGQPDPGEPYKDPAFLVVKADAAGNTVLDATGQPVRVYVSLPVYRAYTVEPAYNGGIGTLNCSDPNTILTYENLYWCNMPNQRPAPGPDPNAPYPDKTIHYKSDYKIHSTPYEDKSTPADPNDNLNVLIDSYFYSYDWYYGPQPYSTFFLGANAGLQYLNKTMTAGDKAAVWVFTNDKIGLQYPDAVSMTDEVPVLLQLTNMMARGMVDHSGNFLAGYPRYNPNFVDMGWIPLFDGDPTRTSTNLVKVIEDAITTLGASCPETAKKDIVLYTDGTASCYETASGYQCDNKYSYYLASELQLIGDGTSLNNTLLQKLIDAKISLNVVHAGQKVEPNFKNVYVTPPDTDTPHYIDLGTGEFASRKYGGLSSPPSLRAGNYTSTYSGACNSPSADQCAFEKLSQNDTRFRRATGMLFELAERSGGFYCPITDLCHWDIVCLATLMAPTCYWDHDNDPSTPKRLHDAYRKNHPYQTCSMYEISKAQQAANCTQQILGSNPYILTPENAHYVGTQ
ncbi:MAG: hypothetical protein D6719_02790 [Candidatus Dadabacteria bacterium]|nr:MAG: hypothetical protein D6719_02790 [Candidatus Dadabacteria bacterium]